MAEVEIQPLTVDPTSGQLSSDPVNVPIATAQSGRSEYWTLALLCTFVTLQSGTHSGLINSSVESLEQQFGFSSFQSGMIISTYDATVMMFAIKCGAIGEADPPKLLGIGLAIFSGGAFMFAVPGMMGWGSETSGLAMMTLMMGQVLIGIGATPLYILTPPYMARSLESSRFSIFLGVFYVFGAVGPALGFVGQGIMMGSFDSYWPSFVLVSLLGAAFALPLYQAPQYMTAKSAAEAAAAPPPDPGQSTGQSNMYALLKNPLMYCNTLGTAIQVFGVSGIAAYLPKLAGRFFNRATSSASMLVGATVVPGAAFGLFFGAFLASRWPEQSRPSAWICTIVTWASIPAHTILLIEEEVFFFFGLIGLMLLVFANNVPATGTMMTVLDPVQRPLALGMQSVATRAVGSVPGPVLFGVMIDSTCLKWSDQGSCDKYDIGSLRWTLIAIGTTCAVISGAFFIAQLIFLPHKLPTTKAETYDDCEEPNELSLQE